MKKKSTHTDEPVKKAGGRKKLDAGRKLDIIGILMIVFATFLFLALVSHSTADERVSDKGVMGIVKLFGGDEEMKAWADQTQNWLGLIGALIARFFILNTVGYFALAFPALLGLWGWFILRRKDLHPLAYYTNYSLVLVFLLATFIGLVRLVTWLPEIPVSWSGNIGDFTAGIISRLIGTMGGIIALLASMLILAVIVVDYDIQTTLDRLRSLASHIGLSIGRKAAAIPAAMDSVSNVYADERATREQSTPVEAPAPPPIAPVATPVAATEHKVLTLTADQALGLQKQKTPISIQWPEAPAPMVPLVDMPLSQPDPNATGETTTPRSNGVISMESLLGARGRQPSQTDVATSIAAAGAAASQATTVAKGAVVASAADAAASSIDSPSAKQSRSSEQPEPTVSSSVSEGNATETESLSDLIVNEHEKKAVQQAVARRMADADSDVDTESTNIRLMKDHFTYRHPTADLLDRPTRSSTVSSDELTLKAELVREKLAIFGIGITSIAVVPGPVVTQFELVPDTSVKISKIVSLADDLALALAARGIRIIAPIPGKSAVGIEIPNNEPEFVHFRSVVEADEFSRSRAHLPLGLGKDIKGRVTMGDLAKMPHLLIAGATGSGKSVGVNVMITSLLYRMKPWEVKFVMVDPKKIELAQYRPLARHFLAICPDIDEEIVTDPANAVIVLKSLELEMDKRYTKLAKAGVRHVNDYNTKVKNGEVKDSETVKHYRLPYIVVVIDELADLMITAAREVEEPIARLAQLARAVGIHLIVATQRPSVDVLTGVIKANFPARIAYQTASRIDSRTILDGPGADQLLGNGDMLFMPNGSPKPERIQNAYLSTDEVERVVEFIASQNGHVRPYQLPSVRTSKKGSTREESVEMDDLLYEAARLIVHHQQGSVSLLQRRLKIGYSRAARIVDQLEVAGIVGPYDGSKGREVLVEDPEMLEEILHTL